MEGKVYFIRRNGLPEANASTRNKRVMFLKEELWNYILLSLS